MMMMPVAKLLFVIFCHSKVKPGGRGGLASSDSGQSWTFPWGFTRVVVSHSIRITAKPQNQRQDEGNRDEHELEVVLQPGELLLYESARLPHGRTSFLRWLLSSFSIPSSWQSSPVSSFVLAPALVLFKIILDWYNRFDWSTSERKHAILCWTSSLRTPQPLSSSLSLTLTWLDCF